MGSKPTHAFVEGEEGGEYCWHYETLARERCGLPRSAHPGELSDFGQKLAEEQSARVAAFNARSAHPASPPDPHPCNCSAAPYKHRHAGIIPASPPEPAPEPCDSFKPEAITAQGDRKVTITAPKPLRRLAEEWMARPCPHPEQPAMANECPYCTMDLLERVIRECAEAACKSGAGCGEPDVIAEIGHRQDCDAPYVLRAFGLAPSPESKP